MHRPAKKSETLEFRLPLPEKIEFQKKAAENGLSVSEVLRGLASDYCKTFTTPSERSSRMRKLSIFGTMALLFGALFSAPAIAEKDIFSVFDIDNNGRLTLGEISSEGDGDIIIALDKNADNWVSAAEFQPKGEGEQFKDISDDFGDGDRQRFLEFVFVTFELAPDRHVTQKVDTGRVPIPFDATDAQVAKIQGTLRAKFTKPTVVPN